MLRADAFIGLRGSRGVVYIERETGIAEDKLALAADKNIAWLEIPMNEFCSVHLREHIDEWADCSQCPDCIPAIGFKLRLERAVWLVLRHQPFAIDVLVQNLQQVRVGNGFINLGFPHQPRDRFFRRRQQLFLCSQDVFAVDERYQVFSKPVACSRFNLSVRSPLEQTNTFDYVIERVLPAFWSDQRDGSLSAFA